MRRSGVLVLTYRRDVLRKAAPFTVARWDRPSGKDDTITLMSRILDPILESAMRHALICSSVLLASCALSVQAANFTVTNTSDSGPGSLRQALLDANSAGGSNMVLFGIAGAGPHTIGLGSALPQITGTLIIDGFSQPGSAPNTLTPDQGGLDTVLTIEVTAATGNYYGFLVQPGAHLTVQGLALNRFQNAILGANSSPAGSGIQVFGNFIGTTVGGGPLAGTGNTGCAVRTAATPVQVGGTLPWQRNLLSGSACGVLVGAAATIEGNLIGTDASGTLAIPNGLGGNWPGILLAVRQNVRIGGTEPAARNLISGNQPWGIGIWPSAGGTGPIANVRIVGNYIGTDWSGTQPLPNGFPQAAAAQHGGGIQLQGTAGIDAHLIGGFGPGEANLIAYNRGSGISAIAGGVAYFDNRGNVIHHNRGVGRANVDIGSVGPTPNDPGDGDVGSNNVQNYPDIVSASQSGDQLTITYRVDSAPANSSYPLSIDFYSNMQGGSGDLIGQDLYPESLAQVDRTIVLTLPPGVSGIPFVAVATTANGYSSEFSRAYDVIFEDSFY